MRQLGHPSECPRTQSFTTAVASDGSLRAQVASADNTCTETDGLEVWDRLAPGSPVADYLRAMAAEANWQPTSVPMGIIHGNYVAPSTGHVLVVTANGRYRYYDSLTAKETGRGRPRRIRVGPGNSVGIVRRRQLLRPPRDRADAREWRHRGRPRPSASLPTRTLRIERRNPRRLGAGGRVYSGRRTAGPGAPARAPGIGGSPHRAPARAGALSVSATGGAETRVPEVGNASKNSVSTSMTPYPSR